MGFHRLCHFCSDPAPQSASCTSAWPWALLAVQGCLTGTKICVQFAPRHDCHVYSVITSICSIGHSANVYLVLFATPGWQWSALALPPGEAGGGAHLQHFQVLWCVSVRAQEAQTS